MIPEIRKNIDTEIDILREISTYINRLNSTSNPNERKMVNDTINSLVKTMKMLNSSIPKLLSNTTLAKPLTQNVKNPGLEKINVKRADKEITVILDKNDREKFLKELSINESLIRNIKRKELMQKEQFNEFKASRGYLKLSNKFFLEKAQRYIAKGYFKSLQIGLKKANIDVLFETYVASIFLTTFLSFFASIFIVLFFIFFQLDTSTLTFAVFNGNYLMRMLHLIWIPFAVPIITFAAMSYYPSTEKDSLEKKIDQELPFAVIHMSAISGSGIEPSQIFKIIAFSNEYPNLRREIRKVLNQINIYGYDLVTSLNNVSKSTPSSKLSELFAGLSTTISSGGSLTEFFEKRSETLLVSYRLEREKYTKIAETFMDIYISVVIAAPMILMLLLIMLSVSSPELGFTPQFLSFLIISVLSLINIVFLVFLHLKQPSY